jgi:tol-pal system protein YbgF
MKRTMATALMVAAIAALWTAPLAHAQATAQAPAPGSQPAPQRPAAQAPKAQQPARPATQPAAKPPEAPADGARPDAGAQLRQRIEQLEEQLVDMQVAVGTLESFARTGASRAGSSSAAMVAGAGGSSDAAMRIDGVEMQVRALSSQIDILTQQMKSLEARLGSSPGRAPEQRGDAAGTAGSGFPPAVATGATAGRPPRTPAVGVPVTETKGEEDTIGGLLRGDGAAERPGQPQQGQVQTQPLPPVGQPPAAPRQQVAAASAPAGNPRELYERAYGNLLQQDYGAAEASFAEFLRQHPNHDLSGNAQYWLGESFYVRGQYRQAASAFLKGYQSYGRSQKAPDSLLKLGMSLDRLGQKEAACSSLGELTSRYPTAPAHIQSRAQSERARIGCP